MQEGNKRGQERRTRGGTRGQERETIGEQRRCKKVTKKGRQEGNKGDARR